MTIDWNKAPEGATHWEPASEHVIAGWMKLEDGAWFYWPPESDKPKWNRARMVTDLRADRMIPRPTTWDGEGLPPAGTVCEVKGYPEGEFCEAEIIAYNNDQSKFWYCADGVSGIHETNKTKFRPLRTPEQIATEAREKAVIEMLELDPFLPNTPTGMLSRTEFCRKLYDHGYRKQEQTK